MAARQSPTAQDKPFTFKSKAGGAITIPSSEVYDPDMDAIAELHAAVTELDVLSRDAEVNDARKSMAQMRVSLASLGVIKSGFSPKVAERIKLKASEVQDFMTSYQQHTGVSIPK